MITVNEDSELLYDVIVVGSGPAGSSAAYFLGKAGKRVLILEKEALPRYKTCGGGISIRFLREQFPFSFDSLPIEAATAICYIFSNQEVTIPLSADAIGMVMRSDLDIFLLRHTQADVIEGAAVQRINEENDRVQVETRDGRRFSAPYLIGADGANSMVARSLGLRNKRTLAAAIEAEVDVPPQVKQRFDRKMVFIFGEIRLGYLWIFSKPNHLSVGIAALHPKPGELQKTLENVMSTFGITLDSTAMRGHPIPIYTRRERITTTRTLLVGDAAGLADPLSGEGIRFAIKSGRMAAEAILDGQPERYPKKLEGSIRLNHKLTQLVAPFFYYLQSPFLFLGTPNPFSSQGVVEMLADRMNTFSFILFGWATLPVFVATELTARCLHRLGKTQLANRLRSTVYPEAVRTAYRVE
jgi:geranylgeranyl reductase family protein